VGTSIRLWTDSRVEKGGIKRGGISNGRRTVVRADKEPGGNECKAGASEKILHRTRISSTKLLLYKSKWPANEGGAAGLGSAKHNTD